MLQSPFAYLVTYETTQPAEKYGPLQLELAASTKWFRHMTNTWIVLRYETLVELNNKLLPLIFTTDRMLIMPAKGPAMGWLPQNAWDWLNENVPREW